MKAPSTRQLKVGEELRHAISDVIMREGFHFADGKHRSVTVSEVRISPDLKNASVYVAFLDSVQDRASANSMIAWLQSAAPEIRHLMGKKVRIRFLPRLRFILDESFDEAAKINDLLSRSEVIRDTGGESGD